MIDAEAAVRAIETTYDRAWVAGDIAVLTSCLTEDVVLVSPRNEVASGRDEVRQFLGAFLDGPARKSTHTSRILRVSFVTDDVAIVDGEAVIEGVEESEFGAATLVHRFTDVLRKRNGQWAIAHIRAYAMITSPQKGMR